MRHRCAGHALFVTLIVLVLVAAAVGLLATHYGLRARMASQEERRIHLNAMTDAAVAESLAKLSEDDDFEGVEERPFAGGTLSSRIEDLPENRREILASANYRGWDRTVRVQVRIEYTGLTVESWSPIRRSSP